VCVCVCVCEGHTVKPAALKCALAADCKVESDNSETIDRDLHNMYILISRLLCLGGGEPGTRYCVPYHNATTTDSITNRG